MGKLTKNPPSVLNFNFNDFEEDNPNEYLTEPRPEGPYIAPVWQDDIAGRFYDNGWDSRLYFKNQAFKSPIDMFVFDDKHWLNVYCKPLEYRITRLNLRKLRSISKRHRSNHSILIYNGVIKPEHYAFAKELNILIINQKDIGAIRDTLTGFNRDYPDSHISRSDTLTADVSMVAIVKELLPSFPERWQPIAREAQRKKERLSSTPFYARQAERDGDSYWVSLAISYRGKE